MYIKLTRMDNTPIWLNAAFIVTIEPRKQGGGSVVVPIGDGLDYDVKEPPEEVLSRLAENPTPTAVPVPPPKTLTRPPADVFAESTLITAVESQPVRENAPELEPGVLEPEAKPHKRSRRGRGRRKHLGGNVGESESRGSGEDNFKGKGKTI